MKTFYLTFGQKYRREENPRWTNTKTQYVHPDGWWEVSDENYIEARKKVVKLFGHHWAGLYEHKFNPEYYSLGKIGEIK